LDYLYGCNKMKLVYHVLADEVVDPDIDIGDVEGMFDKSGECLGCWALNDAKWRGEYMNDFASALGVKISRDLPNSLNDKVAQFFVERFSN
jgi:hypothetical protein